MKNKTIEKIDRIKVNLLQLKPIQTLTELYDFYKKNMDRFFDNKGRPKDYFEKVICPICGSYQHKDKITIDGFRYVQCFKCNSVYNNPRLKKSVLEEMYKSGEYNKYFDKLIIPSQAFRKNVLEERKFKQIVSFFDKPGKILDVACGTGSFLKNFQENGWDVHGVDPSDSAARIAKEYYDLDIVQDYFENFETKQKFDCITFWGLEHLSNPMNGIKKAVNLLDTNGLIVFEGPSADCLLMKYLCKNGFSPSRYIESARHVLFFSHKSIDFICETFGLRVSHIETIGLDIQTILLYDFNDEITKKIMAIQQVIDGLNLGDHYRVFLHKR